MIAPTVLKTCCAGEASTAFLFRISILLLRSDALSLCVCAVITADLVRGTTDDEGQIERVWAVGHEVSRMHRIWMRANVRPEALHRVTEPRRVGMRDESDCS